LVVGQKEYKCWDLVKAARPRKQHEIEGTDGVHVESSWKATLATCFTLPSMKLPNVIVTIVIMWQLPYKAGVWNLSGYRGKSCYLLRVL
jgi:hypothetical protein